MTTEWSSCRARLLRAFSRKPRRRPRRRARSGPQFATGCRHSRHTSVTGRSDMSGLSDQAIVPLEERESIEQRVAQSLRALIVAGQLPEGTQLVQRELAGRLGVSQTPVRASLGRLEQEGFVAVGSTGRAF